MNTPKFKEEPTDYIAPPIESRYALLKEAHNLGHFGSESLVKRLHADGLHWTGIFTEAQQIVTSCVHCARHNVVHRGFHGLKSIVSAEPFSHISTDMAGPFSLTSRNNMYILIVVDICIRYIIARALPNKQSDTIANTLCQIFGDYAFPSTCLVSDNGAEYKNTLMNSITNVLGIPHRFSTPYYPQSNGIAENAAAQLACNLKIRNRTGSSLFSLIFARRFPKIQDCTDPTVKTTLPKKVVTIEDLIKKADYMADIVFPAIHERTNKLMELQRKQFDKKNYLVDIPIGTTVMIRLPSRATKLSPLYDGPFHVVTKTKNGIYVLKDEMNDMLHRDYVPSELKVVTIDEKAIEDQVYEVKEIRDHRGPVSDREYLVCWVGYGERENSWLKSDAFIDPETIRKYWVKINELKKLDEERKAKLVNDDVPNGKKRKQTVPRNTRNLRSRTRK